MDTKDENPKSELNYALRFIYDTAAILRLLGIGEQLEKRLEMEYKRLKEKYNVFKSHYQEIETAAKIGDYKIRREARELAKDAMKICEEVIETTILYKLGRVYFEIKKLEEDPKLKDEINQLKPKVENFLTEAYKSTQDVNLKNLSNAASSLRNFLEKYKENAPLSRVINTIQEMIKETEEARELKETYKKISTLPLITIPILLGLLAVFHFVDFSTQGMFLAQTSVSAAYLTIASMLLVILLYFLFKKK
ncbi:MAG: hypothetical protein QXY24_03970 [Candidatus Aenigmatarchaeota archaeon]